MKKILLLSLCIAISFSSLAQTINPEMPLPQEQSIKKGVL